MLVGVPKEIKAQENRVGLIPPSVRELIGRGHRVMVEAGAGAGIGLSDEDYRAAGAAVVETSDEVFATAEMIVKVKEPQPVECARLREDQVLFTFLHLAPDPVQARGLMESGCVAIAYETVTDDHGGLPLLAPMSEVAGRMSVQVGAHHLQKPEGGMGLLLGPVAGVEPAEVVILGGGVSGSAAADVAIGMGARVTVIEKSLDRLTALRTRFGNRLNGVYSTAESVERYVLAADLVVGAVLLPGAVAPKLVGRELLSAKRPGSVMVDIAIDQGGCFETSRATTHAEPVYTVDGVVHYCVANMPGAVPRTSAYALNYAVLPHVLSLADKGWRRALADDRHLRAGLNVRHGRIAHEAVAAGLGCEVTRTLEEVAA